MLDTGSQTEIATIERYIEFINLQKISEIIQINNKNKNDNIHKNEVQDIRRSGKY